MLHWELNAVTVTEGRRLSARSRSILTGLILFIGLGGEAKAQAEAQYNPHGELDVDCGACHTSESWKPAKPVLEFDHDKQTSFALDGQHEQVLCGSCHLNLRFDEPKISKLQCSSCHVDVHLGNLSDNCISCHNTVSFTDVPGVMVHMQTNFPLTGTHLQISCETCHSTDLGGAFTTLNIDCFSCHEQEYFAAQMPDHAAANFPTDCERCHDTLAWTHAALDHVAITDGYELLGAHAQIFCTSCHIPPNLDLIYLPADQDDCIACHDSDFQRGHSGGGIATTCLDCHTNTSWEGAGLDHAEISDGYELVGAHATLDCNQCHIEPGNELIVTPVNENDCFACHVVDYLNQHAGAGIPTTCLECHNNNLWEEVEEGGGNR